MKAQFIDSLRGLYWGPSAVRDSRLPGGLRSQDSSQVICQAEGRPIPWRHPPGPYFHDPPPCQIWVEIFGYKDPPHELWAAYDRLKKGNGTEEDEFNIRKYVEYHGDKTSDDCSDFFLSYCSIGNKAEECSTKNDLPLTAYTGRGNGDHSHNYETSEHLPCN